ncbi:unnamed protein product [Meloidogyne enterolobii]|uniref:Uncharacterized protein n=1 Tax=Meloidogyne enterolobii TaxID=390850 RepID=A0ACB0ZG29_MELEN
MCFVFSNILFLIKRKNTKSEFLLPKIQIKSEFQVVFFCIFQNSDFILFQKHKLIKIRIKNQN